jgi:hypothetical protein
MDATVQLSEYCVLPVILESQERNSKETDTAPFEELSRHYPQFKQFAAVSRRLAKRSDGWFNENPLCDGATIHE